MRAGGSRPALGAAIATSVAALAILSPDVSSTAYERHDRAGAGQTSYFSGPAECAVPCRSSLPSTPRSLIRTLGAQGEKYQATDACKGRKCSDSASFHGLAQREPDSRNVVASAARRGRPQPTAPSGRFERLRMRPTYPAVGSARNGPFGGDCVPYASLVCRTGRALCSWADGTVVRQSRFCGQARATLAGPERPQAHPIKRAGLLAACFLSASNQRMQGAIAVTSTARPAGPNRPGRPALRSGPPWRSGQPLRGRPLRHPRRPAWAGRLAARGSADASS